jgi:hypothetical protein
MLTEATRSLLLKRVLPVLGVSAAALGGGLLVWHGNVNAIPQERPAVTVAPPAAVPVAPAAAPAATSMDGGVTPVEPPKTTATIVFTTIPATNARVMWGKRLLGNIGPKAPLVITRPRDTGPLDVMVYAPGYIPVQTRAHTFSDNKVSVKLTTPEQKQTLWGYRAPLDAGVPLDPTAAEQQTTPGSEVAAPPL